MEMVTSNKPYLIVGAGKLTAAVWKSNKKRSGSRYRFNVFRLCSETGRATQCLLPSDVPDLVKLARVLAQVIADDGCLPVGLRQRLFELATSIDSMGEKPD